MITMWLKSKKYKGKRIYFLKKEDGWVRYFIGSKKNYVGDSPDKEEAIKDAKWVINKAEE